MPINNSPSSTPRACHGPKYGVPGSGWLPNPNTSAIPEKTDITYPVAMNLAPKSALMLRGSFPRRLTEANVTADADDAQSQQEGCDLNKTDYRAAIQSERVAGLAPSRKTSIPIILNTRPNLIRQGILNLILEVARTVVTHIIFPEGYFSCTRSS